MSDSQTSALDLRRPAASGRMLLAVSAVAVVSVLVVSRADAAPTRSTTIALTSDEQRLVVVNREANRLVTAPTTQPDEFEKILAENHAPSKHAAHEDVYVAIRDAFNAAGRKLQDYVRRTSRTVKTYRPPFEARAIG